MEKNLKPGAYTVRVSRNLPKDEEIHQLWRSMEDSYKNLMFCLKRQIKLGVINPENAQRQIDHFEIERKHCSQMGDMIFSIILEEQGRRFDEDLEKLKNTINERA